MQSLAQKKEPREAYRSAERPGDQPAWGGHLLAGVGSDPVQDTEVWTAPSSVYIQKNGQCFSLDVSSSLV